MTIKFPYGPSPAGAAAARALGSEGASVKWGAGFRTKTLGDFARVEVDEGGTYALTGVRNAAEGQKTVVAVDFRRRFTAGNYGFGVNCDKGLYGGWYADGPQSSSTLNFTYPGYGPVAPSGNGINLPYVDAVKAAPAYSGSNPRSLTGAVLTPSSRVVPQYRFERPLVAAVGRTQNKTIITSYAHKAYFDDVSTPPTKPPYAFPIAYSLGYHGRYADGYVLTSILMSNEGRVDSAGKALLTPAVVRMSRDGAGDFSGYLPLARSSGQEFRIIGSIVTRGTLFVVIAEIFNYYGARVPGKDYRPPVWVGVSQDQGATWSFTDIKAAFAKWFSYPMWQCAKKINWSPHTGPSADAARPGFWMRIFTPMPADGVLVPPDADHSFEADVVQTFTQPPEVEGVTPPPVYTVGKNELFPFEAGAGSFYNATLDNVSATLQAVAVGDDVVLSFAFSAELPGPNAATVYDWNLRWGARMLKITKYGMTLVLNESAPTLDDTALEFYQSIVYLGNNVLLAKKVFGFGGIDFDVKFAKSVDGGTTWAEFSPVGLPCALKNQFLGAFYLEDAINPTTGKHMVLLPCWNQVDSKYVICTSVDQGATWKETGTVAVPDTFRRVDTMYADDGGGNFASIQYTPPVVSDRPIDLAIPDRYPRSAA